IFSRWPWFGLILDISVMGWRFWVFAVGGIARIPYRTVPDWTRDPDPWIYLIFYGLGFVGIRMAVTGDRRPLLFWNVCYVVILDPAAVLSRMSNEVLLRYPDNRNHILMFGAAIATIAIYVGDRRMRMEQRACDAAPSN